MKILPSKKQRSTDYRFLAELRDYSKLSPALLDIAIHGVPFRGKRYPLCYVFWGENRYRKVYITLTKEVGTLIGESIIELPRTTIQRGIVLVGERVTDLSHNVLRFV